MNGFRIRLGPLAFLLTVITLCLSVLAILTLSTARADAALSERYAGNVTQRYELEQKGQTLLRDIDLALQKRDNKTLEKMIQDGIIEKDGSRIFAQMETDGMFLNMVIRAEEEGAVVEDWRIVKEWNEDLNSDPVWDGE